MEAQQFLAQALARIDSALRTHVRLGDVKVAEAMEYALFPGGKRLRPAVAFASGEAVGLEGSPLQRIACTAELIHTASLIVDDLPPMDDSSNRRGKPAVHVVFGDATAILASYAMIVEAFRLCADMPGVLRALADAVGVEGMIGGQARDLRWREGATREEIEEMQRRKTASLFRFSAEAPVTAAKAERETVSALVCYGETLGSLFQLTDDLLDLEDRGPNLVRLIGQRDAQELARSLCERACSEVNVFGQRGENLCALARHILARAV